MNETLEMNNRGIGDNSQDATVRVESRLFNSVAAKAGDRPWRENFELPAGSTIRDLVEHLGLSKKGIFLVMRNGRDVTPGLVGAEANLEPALEDGDVIAFSGPVPYSYGLGAPVV